MSRGQGLQPARPAYRLPCQQIPSVLKSKYGPDLRSTQPSPAFSQGFR